MSLGLERVAKAKETSAANDLHSGKVVSKPSQALQPSSLSRARTM